MGRECIRKKLDANFSATVYHWRIARCDYTDTHNLFVCANQQKDFVEVAGGTDFFKTKIGYSLYADAGVHACVGEGGGTAFFGEIDEL
ncbi:hypothetical protein [Haloferax sp. KTX1]|uniref:hypothetical protein n=1 Tax=Haloferax sp. KTX1 TaxID=2600597 RepID=UPI0011DD279B|nr:hypothetical protein [Haloferax sp. KTX1]